MTLGRSGYDTMSCVNGCFMDYIRLINIGSTGFKCEGFWMRKEEMYCKEMTLVEKVIVAIVRGFQKGNKDCFITNQSLSVICSCNIRTINRALQRLKTEGLLHTRWKSVNGRMMRILWV